LFVGAEYLVREDISGEGDTGGYVGHHDVQSAELRVGWKF
jgi:hypothetical protein